MRREDPDVSLAIVAALLLAMLLLAAHEARPVTHTLRFTTDSTDVARVGVLLLFETWMTTQRPIDGALPSEIDLIRIFVFAAKCFVDFTLRCFVNEFAKST